MRGFIAENEAIPNGHLVSAIVHGKIGDRAPTEYEKIGIVRFLWLGGLDMVAATISQRAGPAQRSDKEATLRFADRRLDMKRTPRHRIEPGAKGDPEGDRRSSDA